MPPRNAALIRRKPSAADVNTRNSVQNGESVVDPVIINSAIFHVPDESVPFSHPSNRKRRLTTQRFSPPNKRSAPDSGIASLCNSHNGALALVSDESLHNGSSQSLPPVDCASISSSMASGLASLSSTSSIPTKVPLSNKSQKFVGAHLQITSGGPQRAIQQAQDMGARAFALFVRGAKRWTAAPLSDDAVRKFREKLAKCTSIQSDKIVCHGSYLINLGAPSADVLHKSRVSFVDEMQRCQRLGISYYNIHPGSTGGKISVGECIDRIVQSIDEALEKTSTVTVLLETMCCQGYTVGGKLTELKEIVTRVRDRSRIGVCLDTCHVYAGGNNISCREGWDKYMTEFDEQIGLDKLKAVHLNDSELPVGSHLDRHAPIGNGWIGTDGFRIVMNDARLNNIPMILETNESMFRHEIDLLYSLCRD